MLVKLIKTNINWVFLLVMNPPLHCYILAARIGSECESWCSVDEDQQILWKQFSQGSVWEVGVDSRFWEESEAGVLHLIKESSY